MSTLSDLPSNHLVAACLESRDADSWAEFVRRFQPAIAASVLRTARCWRITSPGRIEDLVQEVFLRLCADDFRLLRIFEPREPDSIVGYLKVLAANTTRDLLRAQHASKRGGDITLEQEPGVLDRQSSRTAHGVPDAEWSVQLREIEEALQSLIPGLITERDRVIFWLFFRDGCTARDISGMRPLGLTEKGVESSILRTRHRVSAALQGRRGAAKGISGPFPILKEGQ